MKMFREYKKIIIVGVVVVLIVGLVVFLLVWGGGVKQDNYTDQIEIEEKNAPTLGVDYDIYENIDYGFSIEHPVELETEVVYEDNGQTILFQKPNEQIGFQIFITEFDGKEEVLTSSRILEDLESAVIDNPQEVTIGDDIRALIFWSSASGIGKTREVWFIHNGFLYEITTYARLDSWLAQILSTMKFR